MLYHAFRSFWKKCEKCTEHVAFHYHHQYISLRLILDLNDYNNTFYDL